MKSTIIFIFLFLFSTTAFAQEDIAIITDKGTKHIPVYLREGSVYFSLKDFAEAISANHYHSKNTGKIELKFKRYLLKATGKNPYIIITPRSTGIPIVYQLPSSSYVIDNKVYVPLKYFLEPLQSAYGRQLSFEEPNKLFIGDEIDSPLESQQWVYTNPNLPPVTGNSITGLSINEMANGTLIRVHSKTRIPSYYSSLNDGVLKIIFRNVNADVDKTNRNNLSSLIKNIETENVGQDTEFRFMLGDEYSTNEVINAPGSTDILITIHNKIFTTNGATEKYIEKWDFDVIVIDAGHGGKDPGAIGVNKLKEKDINLKVALKLGKLIEEEMPDVKIVYTRKSDKFIDLYKRGKIANENEGSLFISIHCNSNKKNTPNGIEVYLLRPGRTQEAIDIAERENSVIEFEEEPERYKALTDENFILVSMAHSSYMKYSEKFSDFLNKEFTANLSLKSRGVKQAGFYVLVGASMPSVLIESGFISNKEDSDFLKNDSGQQQLAVSIFGAIKTYRKYYEKEMEAEM
jgi:N-acetylmuramoyl-L-alanine amidase